MTHRRPDGTGTLRARGDRWQSSIRDPRTGRTRAKTWPLGTGRREAERLHREWVTEIRTVGIGDRRITLEAWLTRWLDRLDAGGATTYRHSRNVDTLVGILGHVPLGDLTTMVIEDELARLPAATSSLRSLRWTLGRALAEARRRGLVPAVATVGVELPRRATVERTVPTTDEIRAVVAAEDDPLWRTVITLAAGTGMRFGELAGLRWGDLELGAATITIARTKTTDGEGRPRIGSTTKTGRARVVVVAPEVVAALQAWRAELGSRGLAHVRADRAVFPARNATGSISSPMMSRAMAAACERAGVERFTAHGIRHWFASEALRNGADPAVLARSLGHSQAQLLATYGVHTLPGALADIPLRMPSVTHG